MRLLLVMCVAVAPATWAQGPCFDLTKKVVNPRRESLPLPASGGDVADSGKDKGRVWARLRGVSKVPIERVYAFLQDPRKFKDPSVDELTLTSLEPGPFLSHFTVHALVKPFVFVRIEWTDEWGFTLVEGTPQRPETIVLAYQKVEGTSHIEHYCGTIVLKRLDDTSTDIAQYEESKITGKNLDDQIKGIADFLAVLRTRP